MKKLPQAELDIMNCLWNADTKVERIYFNNTLAEKKRSDSTVLTLLTRLHEKGFVGIEKNKIKNIYFSTVSRQDYVKVENKNFLKQIHNNSVKNLFASMVDTNNLSKQDIQSLQNLLEDLKNNSKY